MPFSVDAGHGYLTTLLGGQLESQLLDHRLVPASYAFVNITACSASQQKATAKLAASNQLRKTTLRLRPEACPANVPDETLAEPSGAQNNGEVRAQFVCLTAELGLTVILAARSRGTLVVQRCRLTFRFNADTLVYLICCVRTDNSGRTH